MKSAKRLHSVSGLFAFLLVGVFALFALAIIASGVGAYRSIGSANRLGSQQRVALGYVSGKLRALGDRGGVSIRGAEGARLLVLSEEVDGATYETRIFFDGGRLCEQFCEASLAFDPEGAESIAVIPDFSFERTGDLIALRAQLSDGSQADAFVALRAGEGGGRDAL